MTLQEIATTGRGGCADEDELSAMGHHLEAAELHGRKRLALAVHARDCTGVFPELPRRFRAAAAQLTRLQTCAGVSERFTPQQRSLRRDSVPCTS